MKALFGLTLLAMVTLILAGIAYAGDREIEIRKWPGLPVYDAKDTRTGERYTIRDTSPEALEAETRPRPYEKSETLKAMEQREREYEEKRERIRNSPVGEW